MTNDSTTPHPGWDVVVTMPGRTTAPRTVTIGPARSEYDAATWAGRLMQQMTATVHPEGTEITTAPHASGCDHPDAYETHPCNGDALAAILRSTREADDPVARFPDLLTRMIMIHGADDAGSAWLTACGIVDRDAEVDEAVAELARTISTARNAVSHATVTLTRLRSNQVYDVELAEGGNGADLLHELDVAARALRNAARIAEWRRSLDQLEA